MKKELRRDPNNKIIAGVCSGIAKYLDIDPTFKSGGGSGGQGFRADRLFGRIRSNGVVLRPLLLAPDTF